MMARKPYARQWNSSEKRRVVTSTNQDTEGSVGLVIETTASENRLVVESDTPSSRGAPHTVRH